MTTTATSGATAAANSTLIGEAEFAAVYAAAEFAEAFGLRFNTTVTIAWKFLGAETPQDVQGLFNSLLKCLRDWFAQRRLPQAWLYAHENGAQIGLHTHIAIALPGALLEGDLIPNRDEFRRWIMSWAQRRLGRRTPRAIRVRGPRRETPWLHWLATHYLVKGYDPAAEALSARNSPDGRTLYLGDLIAFPFRDPGHVPLQHRVHWSRSLGPDRRKLGVPGGFDDLLEPPAKALCVDPFRRTTFMAPGTLLPADRRLPAFRSKYEDGVRDVRLLYPKAFWTRISPGKSHSAILG